MIELYNSFITSFHYPILEYSIKNFFILWGYYVSYGFIAMTLWICLIGPITNASFWNSPRLTTLMIIILSIPAWILLLGMLLILLCSGYFIWQSFVQSHALLFAIICLGIIWIYFWTKNLIENSNTDITVWESLVSSNPEQQKMNEERYRIEAQRKKQEILDRRNKMIPENYVQKFLIHAERKHSKVDKYGNRDKSALNKEVIDYMRMITNETITDWYSKKWILNFIDALSNGRWYPQLNDDYQWLNNYLRQKFSEYLTQKEEKIKKGEMSIDSMSGIEFEKYLWRIFERAGYTIEFTPESGDQWADLIARKWDKSIVIQAKRYTNSVGNWAIQEVIGAIRYYDGDEWWVITNSMFTSSARELARKNSIKLVDGSDLNNLPNLI